MFFLLCGLCRKLEFYPRSSKNSPGIFLEFMTTSSLELFSLCLLEQLDQLVAKVFLLLDPLCLELTIYFFFFTFGKVRGFTFGKVRVTDQINSSLRLLYYINYGCL